MEKYLKLYKQRSDEQLKKWGRRYPPLDWSEFEAWNSQTCQRYLSEGQEWKSEVIKTKVYVDLLDNTEMFGFFVAFQKRDYEILNNVLYQTSRQKLLDRSMTASGTDHANVLMNAACAFACNDFEIIDYFFPKVLPLSKGRFYTEVSVNLLKILYYKQDNLLDEALKKAGKFLSKKITSWEKYVVAYFLALVNRDAEQANTCLQELFTAYQKMGDFDKLEKCFAAEIHGFYRFAKIIDEEFFQKLEYPKHNCFFKEFEIWQKAHHYPKGKLFYIYPAEMDYMNKIFEAQLPEMALIEEKVGNRTEIYKDVEKFALDLTENVKKILK
jgi:hypothetical protein